MFCMLCIEEKASYTCRSWRYSSSLWVLRYAYNFCCNCKIVERLLTSCAFINVNLSQYYRYFLHSILYIYSTRFWLLYNSKSKLSRYFDEVWRISSAILELVSLYSFILCISFCKYWLSYLTCYIFYSYYRICFSVRVVISRILRFNSLTSLYALLNLPTIYCN